MHRPLFILLITLLLLRGWVGDAMATGMAAGQLEHRPIATERMAGHADAAGVEDHAGHLMAPQEAMPAGHSMAGAPDCAGQAPDQHAQGSGGHCDSCAACQACHTVALSLLALPTTSLAVLPALPHSSAAQFASAVAALGQKPPIS